MNKATKYVLAGVVALVASGICLDLGATATGIALGFIGCCGIIVGPMLSEL
jgi:hypothetical protein